ncbi:hypothetical protein [Burkholderia thailandensis]|uniref:Uncharacterized protein n=1 Tax=Burkholderia thailandensis TaxID=57975 RepID=A0AAW9CK24_BURTH|nr:hypothetical protein [Burkholderia thailandensis]AVR27935.1 hypothetical protein A8H32_23490 [Burkholderia thailandensis]MDD1483347.1 hypothetical protein [Burkholderia thailandensis]MDD1489476.1 hypothetical protein [Burkholderia thailandensis]MDD1495490.1 hypothetical protein [Burkholderia thailandensis]MDW9235694.1 hypothetical protein [Burkholderia thailandensis]
MGNDGRRDAALAALRGRGRLIDRMRGPWGRLEAGIAGGKLCDSSRSERANCTPMRAGARSRAHFSHPEMPTAGRAIRGAGNLYHNDI